MQIEERLNDLKASGTISSWRIANLNSDGEEGKSNYRNTQKLILEFPDGNSLELGTFCSGCLEDTVLV